MLLEKQTFSSCTVQCLYIYFFQRILGKIFLIAIPSKNFEILVLLNTFSKAVFCPHQEVTYTLIDCCF